MHVWDHTQWLEARAGPAANPGGIYVSLLMVLGGLSTRDAVPLSKGIAT